MADHFVSPVFTVTVKLKKLSINPPPVSQTDDPSPVEEISLGINVRSICNHFLVTEDDTMTLVTQHETLKLHLAFDRLLVSIFDGSDDALEQYLSEKFERYERQRIDAGVVANEIKRQWVEMREEVNSGTLFGRVLPLQVSLRLWHSLMISGGGGSSSMNQTGNVMVPASEGAVEERLKRIEEVEEMEEGDWCCVICLEEMKKEEKSEVSLLQMPCLHVFHGECIKKWLKNSHYCPTCRFQMPTD